MGGSGFIFIILLVTIQQHLEMPGQPMRVYLPDATKRGSALVHLKNDYSLVSHSIQLSQVDSLTF